MDGTLIWFSDGPGRHPNLLCKAEGPGTREKTNTSWVGAKFQQLVLHLYVFSSPWENGGKNLNSKLREEEGG